MYFTVQRYKFPNLSLVRKEESPVVPFGFEKKTVQAKGGKFIFQKASKGHKGLLHVNIKGFCRYQNSPGRAVP
jgi:hypothetical protein